MHQARSDAELSAAMYGGEPAAAPAPAAPPAEGPRTFEQLAAAMHDKPEPLAEELPPEVKALRDADPARAVYDDRTQYQAAGIDKALAELGIEGQAAELAHREWAGVFVDAGLTPQDAADMVRVGLIDEPTPEEAAAWPEQAHAALREAYGDDAQQALADARLLVRRDPRLKDFLNRTGLGDHPAVVKLAARRARELIASGKLKRS
jgi:hypothetical protein